MHRQFRFRLGTLLELGMAAASLAALTACDTTEEGGGSPSNTPITPAPPISDGGFTLPEASAPADSASPPYGDGGSVVPAEPSAWCKVQPLFERYCTSCHDGQGTAGAPMALREYGDLAADSLTVPGSKVYQRAGARMHDATKPMPPQGGVSAADQQVIDAWIDAGAPAGGSTTCTPPAVVPDAGVAVGEWPADCEEKYKFVANAGTGKPFNVGAGREFYQDFTFTAPWSGDVQAVAFRNITDNKKVIHHWILYQGTDAFLVGWSPGKNDKELPADVGVHMPATGTLKLTSHYYNALPGATAETDASGVEVCVTKKKRPKTAFTMPFAANPSIPANGQRVQNADTCTVRSTEPVHLITSSPHMHKLGVHAKFTVQRAGGNVEVIHDLPFNFEEQTTYPIDVVLNNGDRVTTTCIYSNPTNRAVSFGQTTDQEMCFNFALYYPMCAMTCTPTNVFASVVHGTQGGGCPR